MEYPCVFCDKEEGVVPLIMIPGPAPEHLEGRNGYETYACVNCAELASETE